MIDGLAVVTTFPDDAWDVYAKRMLESYIRFWPVDVPIMVCLDSNKLVNEVQKVLRPIDLVVSDQSIDQQEFIKRNQGKDDPRDYRKQYVRFSYKVFAIARAFWAWSQMLEAERPRYLCWLDADVETKRQVTREDILACLPKDGDCVAYLGRKDWPHSECGWLAFDMQNEAASAFLKLFIGYYVGDKVLKLDEWHDSWVFDHVLKKGFKGTNLTEGKPGTEIWEHSPLAGFSHHYKGPAAKMNLANENIKQKNELQSHGYRGPITIITKNSVPDDVIQGNIIENIKQIKHWLHECKKNDETIVVASGGPSLNPFDLISEVDSGRKIVAVKNALSKLKEADIKPWACILLDPRPHVMDFIENPDKDILWFVATQVQPNVVKRLIDAGCMVVGYHASVGAGEDKITAMHPQSVLAGGSATATRGLFLLDMLGFRKFRLYGYDLCFDEKPDMNAIDNQGQPKYMEVTLAMKGNDMQAKKTFWTEPQLYAQHQELEQMLSTGKWEVEAFGAGILPFTVNFRKRMDLRNKVRGLRINGGKPPNYGTMLCRMKKEEQKLWIWPPRWWPKTRLKPKAEKR